LGKHGEAVALFEFVAANSGDGKEAINALTSVVCGRLHFDDEAGLDAAVEKLLADYSEAPMICGRIKGLRSN